MDTSLHELGQPTMRGVRVPNQIAYRHVRESVTELLSTNEVDVRVTVPSCPQWTIQDLLGHLVNVTALAIGQLSGWPAARATPPTHMDTVGLLDEWARLGTTADQLIADCGGRAGTILVMDTFTHELDLRYALGADLPDEHSAFAGAFEVLATGFANSVTAHRLPAVRLSSGDTQWTIGHGEPTATLTADRYDLYRSLAGRRTHDQITALDWDRDSHRWLPAFTWGPFCPPESPVEPLIR
ncbi:MAG: maleylpyruvate isomerase family mycothiol-dependent enzyme [Actinophytocola sp.]|uniref:maleylpyruvate isomerase family mycothiol-dependent enzyme n=1 Tax=Actinophytocola sp. TaxID=1872138 RepID=UPI00132616F3|nr:maleylpyruvate isomerase family mycothiol-dependent enzyme [Actinophytocola sp.]MPZ81280.1 maleylpyruvate isomerase family mycothiol-dependent enzyme [Actinophytocola sp.]